MAHVLFFVGTVVRFKFLTNLQVSCFVLLCQGFNTLAIQSKRIESRIGGSPEKKVNKVVVWSIRSSIYLRPMEWVSWSTVGVKRLNVDGCYRYHIYGWLLASSPVINSWIIGATRGLSFTVTNWFSNKSGSFLDWEESICCVVVWAHGQGRQMTVVANGNLSIDSGGQRWPFLFSSNDGHRCW